MCSLGQNTFFRWVSLTLPSESGISTSSRSRGITMAGVFLLVLRLVEAGLVLPGASATRSIALVGIQCPHNLAFELSGLSGLKHKFTFAVSAKVGNSVSYGESAADCCS